MIVRILIAAALALFTATAEAHKPSDSYLTLRVDDTMIDGRWDIALRDLDAVLDLDRNADGAIDWGEVKRREAEIGAYAIAHLALSAGGACSLRVADLLIDHHTDGAYAVLGLRAACASRIVDLGVDYELLFDIDAQHRGLLKLESAAGSAPVSAVFPQDRRKQTFAIAEPSAWRQFRSYVTDGITHIAAGFDHLLFLAALLLPAVLLRDANGWRPTTDFRRALKHVAGTITAFTVAHSITLSLATLGVVALPSRLVESLIALSVLLAAVDNLVPILPRRRWVVAFAFGLLHGFGFASVLADLQLPASSLALSLFGFNVGVEIGQLVFVLLIVPAAYLLRDTYSYRRFGLAGGSAAIALMASGWLIERSFDLKLMPF